MSLKLARDNLSLTVSDSSLEPSSEPVSGLTKVLPLEAGFSMPAEWSPHAATWLAWPHNNENWLGYLDGARREYKQLVEAIAEDEPVRLMVANEESLEDVNDRMLHGDVTLHSVPFQDSWLRDSGPIFVQRQSKFGFEVALTNWEFNAWGNKFEVGEDNNVPSQMAGLLGTRTFDAGFVMEGGSLEVDGLGTCITTRQCLLSPERNANSSQEDLELALRNYLGIRQVIWLENGLEGDHTDGHVDTITRFVGPGVVVTSLCDDSSDPNHAVLNNNLEILRVARDARGQSLRVVGLPLPKYRMELSGQLSEEAGLSGERLPLTYANFYITNRSVIVPIFDDPHDALALLTLQQVFGLHKVIGLPARSLIAGGGAFHCLTQQQPVGTIWP